MRAAPNQAAQKGSSDNKQSFPSDIVSKKRLLEPLEPLGADAIKRLAAALEREGVVFTRAAAIRRPIRGHEGREQWALAARRHVEASKSRRPEALACASGVWLPRDALPAGIAVEQLRRTLGSERFAAQTADFDLNGNSECRLIFFASCLDATEEDVASWRRVARRPARAAIAVGCAVVAALGIGGVLLWSGGDVLPLIGRAFGRPAVAGGAALIGVAMAAGWMLAGLMAQARAFDAPALEAETQADATREVPTGGGEPVLAAEAAARRAVARGLRHLAAAARPGAASQA